MSFEEIVEHIYLASVDPEAWPSALHEVAQTVDAAICTLLTRRNDAWIGWRHSCTVPAAIDDYLRSPKAAESQSTPRLLQVNRPGFVADHEVFSLEEWRADPLFTECLGPLNLLHGAATAIHVPTGDTAIVQVQRGAGLPVFDSLDIGMLDAFRPHLARAAMLAVRWRLEKLRAATQALELVGIQAAAVSSNGQVHAANDLIQTSAPWIRWLARDRLSIVDPAANAIFRQSMSELGNPSIQSARSIPIRGTDTYSPAVVHLIPMIGWAKDLFGGAMGLVVITPVTMGGAPCATILHALYDLTPAEARVAQAITEGLSIEQIASRSGTSLETVRAQTKSIFAKTGTSRQAQVAALLSGLSLA